MLEISKILIDYTFNFKEAVRTKLNSEAFMLWVILLKAEQIMEEYQT